MFTRSWQLVRESWTVLRQDKELIWFPILSGIVSLLVVASFVIPMVVTSMSRTSGTLGEAAYYIVGFSYYLVSYFVVTFFSAALVGAAKIRLSGGDPTVAQGFQVAKAHLVPIFFWSLLSATIGMILRAISERSELLGQIVVAILGGIWSVITLFVVPILVLEDRPIGQAIRESGSLFKKTWGESVIGQLSMGLIFFLLGLLGVIPIILAFLVQSVPLMIFMVMIALLYWVGLSIVSASLGGIFLTALYLYARTGKVPAGFSPELIERAFTAKQPKVHGVPAA